MFIFIFAWITRSEALHIQSGLIQFYGESSYTKSYLKMFNQNPTGFFGLCKLQFLIKGEQMIQISQLIQKTRMSMIVNITTDLLLNTYFFVIQEKKIYFAQIIFENKKIQSRTIIKMSEQQQQYLVTIREFTLIQQIFQFAYSLQVYQDNIKLIPSVNQISQIKVFVLFLNKNLFQAVQFNNAGIYLVNLVFFSISQIKGFDNMKIDSFLQRQNQFILFDIKIGQQFSIIKITGFILLDIQTNKLQDLNMTTNQVQSKAIIKLNSSKWIKIYNSGIYTFRQLNKFTNKYNKNIMLVMIDNGKLKYLLKLNKNFSARPLEMLSLLYDDSNQSLVNAAKTLYLNRNISSVQTRKENNFKFQVQYLSEGGILPNLFQLYVSLVIFLISLIIKAIMAIILKRQECGITKYFILKRLRQIVAQNYFYYLNICYFHLFYFVPTHFNTVDVALYYIPILLLIFVCISTTYQYIRTKPQKKWKLKMEIARMLKMLLYYPSLVALQTVVSQSIILIILNLVYLIVLLLNCNWRKPQNIKEILVNSLILVILSVVIVEFYIGESEPTSFITTISIGIIFGLDIIAIVITLWFDISMTAKTFILFVRDRCTNSKKKRKVVHNSGGRLVRNFGRMQQSRRKLRFK